MKKLSLSFILVVTLLSVLVFATSSQKVLAQEQPVQDEQTENIHPVPQIPIIVDGVKMAPEEITKFNGQELYYLVDNESDVLYIFTTLEGITKQAEQTNVKNNEISSSNQMMSCYEYSAFYQGTYLSGGGPWFVKSGTQVSFGSGPYAFLNNDIESAQTTTCNVYTKLYDNTNYTGSQLWLACCGTTNNLGIYGWNNRAGSIKVD
ncbi:MAG: hypothetical protein KC449_11490 [Anaerolineales bacterium]|nr:hypothetical protein [Anaerolineales bacterium]